MISQRYCNALELPKVLAMLAEKASCQDSVQRVLEIVPAQSFSAAKRLLTQTSDASMLMRRFGQPTILSVKNPASSLKRAKAGGLLSMRELLSLGEVLRNIRGLWEWHGRCDDTPTALDDHFSQLEPNKYLEDRISGCILSEEEMNDSASPALLDIRRKIRGALGRAKDQLDKIVKSSTYQKYLQENIVTIRDGRYVIPVKAEMRGEIKGLVHDVSASGQTLFVEPIGVVEANNEVKMLQGKEQVEMERILQELSVEAGSFADSILNSYYTLIDLDVLFAKAALALSMHATEPLLTENGHIDLKKARHPLIDPQKVVPTNIQLGGEFDTLVITGPNTGGKTVALKTLGLLTLMAMCGLLIPAADESRISYFDNILVDIGDEQSIEQSLSTFSAHMTNIISILKIADHDSLVLLDELGAGTDPVEGAALAMAILEKLAIYGCKVAATTHYAELKLYALQTSRVQNACCEFDVETLRPTYKLLIGIPGKSNAFAITERLGMEDSVVRRARSLVSEENQGFEDVIGDLQNKLTQAEKQLQEAETDRIAAARARKEAEESKRRFEAQRDKEIEKAKLQAKRIVDDVRFQSDQILNELEEIRQKKNKEEIAALAQQARIQMKQKFRKLQLQASPSADGEEPVQVENNRPVQIGDVVLIAGLNQQAEVISVDQKSGKAVVVAGIIKTRVDLNKLKIIGTNRSVTYEGGSTRRIKSGVSGLKAEIDLRGKTVEEAMMDLDQYLDAAVMAGLPSVTIIHGKGTGALRKGIHQYLKSHKNIDSFRLGVYGEGESGVTVAQLK